MFPKIYEKLAQHGRMTIDELCRRTGINRRSMTNKLSGRTEFTRVEMLNIQAVLGGTLDELFEQTA